MGVEAEPALNGPAVDNGRSRTMSNCDPIEHFDPLQGMSAAEAVRFLSRRALKGALATLDQTSGHPYASLVTIATEPDGTPLFLISRLALHTQNLARDARASLLIEASAASGDPLAGGRATLIGSVRPTASPTARRRFLARHPEAEMYAGFADFSFFALDIERAHFVGGFGRIVDLAAADIRLDTVEVAALAEAEPDIVAHMNADHAAAVELYATALCAAASGPWRMTGIDAEGLDLMCGGVPLRLPFAKRIASAEEARQELVGLAAEARRKGAERGA